MPACSAGGLCRGLAAGGRRELAGGTRAGQVRRGVLEVLVANSTLVQELGFQKAALVARLAELAAGRKDSRLEVPRRADDVTTDDWSPGQRQGGLGHEARRERGGRPRRVDYGGPQVANTEVRLRSNVQKSRPMMTDEATKAARRRADDASDLAMPEFRKVEADYTAEDLQHLERPGARPRAAEHVHRRHHAPRPAPPGLRSRRQLDRRGDGRLCHGRSR